MPSYSNAAASTDGGAAMTTTTETGRHVLKIKKYSKTKGVGFGNPAVSSGAFTAGGHRWRIHYYPDGYSDAAADCICFDLALADPAPAAAEVKAAYSFSLLDSRSGEPVPEHTQSFGVCAFSGEVPSWGDERFIERAELEASPYLRDDSFSVRCDVTVFKDMESPAKVGNPMATRRGRLGAVVRFFFLFFALLAACSAVFMYYVCEL